MKKLFFLIISSVLLLTTVTGAIAAPLSPGLAVLSEADPMVISGVIGEPVRFSSTDFRNHTGLSSYASITVSSLPDESEGTLTVDGKAIEKSTRLSESDCDSLVFTPSEGVTKSEFTFTAANGYETRCTVLLTETENRAPTASSSLTTVMTFSGMSISGHMVASDADGDKLIYEITKEPALGEISYDKNSGRFTYKGTKEGSDSFTFRARDSFGNYSEKATVSLNVSRNTTGISFKDMKENGAYAAAVMMTDEGILTAREEGGNVFFEPTEKVTRLDFLVCTMNALGAANLPTVSDTGFTDDSDIPENAKSYVYSARRLGIINGKQDEDGALYFDANGYITAAEAAVIINNIIGYNASCDYCPGEEIPAWAEDSLYALHELGIICASSAGEYLTKADCASLLSSLTSLV